jgi:glucose-6-phosphate isomerase
MIELKSYANKFISTSDFDKKLAAARGLIDHLKDNNMSGWVDLPVNYDKSEFARIKAAAKKIQQDSKYLVCIGIGGSYLGHKAVIEALDNHSATKILYAGNSLSPLELDKVLAKLGDADFSINVISKSGTTTEPAVAFRIFRQKLIEKYGNTNANARTYATTDSKQGALHDEAIANNYEMFVVPDDIGGRYSVLTAVGLLPIAVSGIDIDELMSGAATEREALISDGGSAATYAALRNTLYEKDFNIEILANFEPTLLYFNEWWKQLFGESEGKDGKGIYPASVIDSTDLHSMGQYIQDGRRNLFETFVKITAPTGQATVPKLSSDLDGLGYLEGRELSYINNQAQIATREAHLSGGVPVLEITMPNLSAHSLGALIYFFEMSCALSGFLLGIDPFNQPGVEAYKNNMFRLLGKPGFSQ